MLSAESEANAIEFLRCVRDDIQRDIRRLNEIATRLSRTIPTPRRPIAKPSKTWRKLRPGQLVRNLSRWFMSGDGYDFPEGTTFQIVAVDSLGMMLLPYGLCEDPTCKVCADGLHTTDNCATVPIRWTDPQWESALERVKKGAAGA